MGLAEAHLKLDRQAMDALRKSHCARVKRPSRLDNMRSFRRRYTTAKGGIPASDRSRFVRTDKVVRQLGKRTRFAWKAARRAERRSGWRTAYPTREQR